MTENDTNVQVEETESKLPYLVLKVGDGIYAVNGETISSIFVLEQQVTMVPKTESHIDGIINVRGEVLPLIDLRLLLGMPSLKEEQRAFIEMIEARKQDHFDWVAELRHSVETETPFNLTTDPHKCKFGKWYDSYENKFHSAEIYFSQIDAPHKKVHEAAEKVNECFQKIIRNEDLNGSCYRSIFSDLEKNLLPQLVDLLDSTVDAITTSERQMVVIVQNDDAQIGILVDEVLEVTAVFDICELSDVTNTHHSRFVCGVGRIEDLNRDILLLDTEELVKNSNRVATV